VAARDRQRTGKGRKKGSGDVLADYLFQQRRSDGRVHFLSVPVSASATFDVCTDGWLNCERAAAVFVPCAPTRLTN
jgi:hypothetical protein